MITWQLACAERELLQLWSCTTTALGVAQDYDAAIAAASDLLAISTKTVGGGVDYRDIRMALEVRSFPAVDCPFGAVFRSDLKPRDL